MTDSNGAAAEPDSLNRPSQTEADVRFSMFASRYQLVDEIGRGGMGVIFRATDTVLAREVAVKLLQDRFGSTSTAARRFVDEAHIAGQLQHPGIPAVHDLGALPNGRPFLVMKLIKGRTLDKLLNDRSPDSPNFIAVFEQVCQAIAVKVINHYGDEVLKVYKTRDLTTQ